MSEGVGFRGWATESWFVWVGGISQLRRKDLLGPVTRVKKKKKKVGG